MASRTTDLLLATCSELYRQELGAEEDVHRALPFFGTALGIVIAAIGYAAGRLPRLPDTAALWPVAASGVLLALAIVEAGFVLFWLGRAIARRDYKRVGPEAALVARLDALRAYYEGQGILGERQDVEMAQDLRQLLVESYRAVTPVNRALNQRRYQFRAIASSHLVRSLIWALGATTVILVADKLGYLPKMVP